MILADSTQQAPQKHDTELGTCPIPVGVLTAIGPLAMLFGDASREAEYGVYCDARRARSHSEDARTVAGKTAQAKLKRRQRR